MNKTCVDDGRNDKLGVVLQRDLNMNNNAIINLAPLVYIGNVTNKRYVDENSLHIDGTNKMIVNLVMENSIDIINFTDRGDGFVCGGEQKYVHQSRMTPSGQRKDAFRYLMEDADRSSSDNNISVSGTVDF